MGSQIIVYNQDIMNLSHEILTHGGCRIGGNKLHAGSVFPCGQHNMEYSIAPYFFRSAIKRATAALLLSDGAVNTDDALIFWLIMVSMTIAVFPV
jgi:hypothetical protein